MQKFSSTPKEMIASAWRHKALIASLTQREVVGRYRGSMLGLLWSFVLPLFMLAVYTFVFSMVFKARWNSDSSSKTEFALILFAGLLVFNLFSECFNRAPVLIISNQNYVKKVLFPLEILPWINLFAALFHTFISYLVWQVFYVIFFGLPPLTVLLFPVVIVPLVFFTLGLSWILASISVYLRDLAQLAGVMTTVLMFMSPIFYPLSALPKSYQGVIGLNPLSFSIEYARDVLFFGNLPNILSFLIYSVASFLFAWIGFSCFQKLRSGFADVV